MELKQDGKKAVYGLVSPAVLEFIGFELETALPTCIEGRFVVSEKSAQVRIARSQKTYMPSISRSDLYYELGHAFTDIVPRVSSGNAFFMLLNKVFILR